MNEVYLRPVNPESIVRMPERGGAVMPAHGAKVKLTPYWRKRMRDCSVFFTSKEEFEQAEKAAQAAAQDDARKAHAEAVKAQKKTSAKTKSTAKTTGSEDKE